MKKAVITDKNLFIFNGSEEPVITPLNGIQDEMNIPKPKYITTFKKRIKNKKVDELLQNIED
jgi:hypothetical protein